MLMEHIMKELPWCSMRVDAHKQRFWNSSNLNRQPGFRIFVAYQKQALFLITSLTKLTYFEKKHNGFGGNFCWFLSSCCRPPSPPPRCPWVPHSAGEPSGTSGVWEGSSAAQMEIFSKIQATDSIIYLLYLTRDLENPCIKISHISSLLNRTEKELAREWLKKKINTTCSELLGPATSGTGEQDFGFMYFPCN